MPTKKQVLKALEKVVDPEIGENIVDMGFVRHVSLKANKVRVVMTLTTPFCPMANIIIYSVKEELKKLEGVKEVEVEMDFDNPWKPEMMKDDVRKRLGFD